MKKPKRYYLILLATLPFDLFAWLLILIIRLLWGQNLHWEGVTLQTELKPDSWPKRTWYKKWGGTNFGHGTMLSPEKAGNEGIDTPTEYHESIHGEQIESAMLSSLMFALILFFAFSVPWFVCLGIWCSGAFIPYFCATIVALLRGEEAYRGNHFEESAYSQTELWQKRFFEALDAEPNEALTKASKNFKKLNKGE